LIVLDKTPVEIIEAEDQVKDVAAGITLTAAVSQNRSIVIQTYLPRDATIEQFNALMDKLSLTADRQEAKVRLEEERANLALEEKTLKQFEEDFSQMDARAEAVWQKSGRKGPYRPSPAEVAQKGTAETNIRRYREAITKRKAEISKCEAIIAKVD
jgi:hypothetical protein